MDERAPRRVPDLDTEIVVYCIDVECESSVFVGERLRFLGYTNVRHYADGKADWMAAGLPRGWRDLASAMAKKRDTLVFIPAWNEEDNLAAVLHELRTEFPDADVLVVDDGLTDHLPHRAGAGRRGAVVRREPRAACGDRCRLRGTPRSTATSTAAASTPTASIQSRSCGS